MGRKWGHFFRAWYHDRVVNVAAARLDGAIAVRCRAMANFFGDNAAAVVNHAV